MTQQRTKSNYESKALRELASLSEAQLQSQIIEPLLRSLGFENVRDNSGPGEKGKDLVATKKSEFGRKKLYGIQIKKKKLSARINSKNSLGSLFLQLLQARHEEVVDPTTNISRSPDACVFITPYPISPSVWEKFHKLSQKLDDKNIEIIDGSKLLDLIESHLPYFLDHFSLKVRYRYQLERDLNQIPESTLAFGLTTELELDNIYVDASLSDSDDLFELIVAKPASLEGRKLIVASPTDIDHLNAFGDWLGVKPRITAPPIADSPQEEEERIFELGQTIKKGSKKKCMQVDIDPLILKLKERSKDALLEFSKISSCIDEDDCTQIATNFISIQDKLRDFRDFELIFQNWIDLVEPGSKSEWDKPQIEFPSSLLERINCNKYILGEPGIGKTTLLRRFAQNLLRSSNEVLPIFVPLALVREPSKEGLVNACIHQLKNQGYQLGKGKSTIREFISKVSSGNFHLFLDGIDEAGPNSDELLGCIEEFSLEHPHCRIMASCRSTFIVPPFRGSLRLILTPFSDEQLSCFLEKWFTSQPSLLVEIKEWLESNLEMREAASSPLVAALLCSLFHSGAEMPSTEIDLYERRFDLLLGKWDQAKGIRRLHLKHQKRYWKFITELAFHMHLKKNRRVSIPEASSVARDYFSEKYHGSDTELIFDCIHRGVLGFEAFGGVSFGHLIYQEYLTSTKLIMENDLSFIYGKIMDPWWANTIEFYAASKEDISSLIKFAIKKECTEEEAERLLVMAQLAKWTDKDLIEELDKIADITLIESPEDYFNGPRPF